MSARLLLVRNGLEGAAPWMAQVHRTHAAPADVVLLRIGDHSPVRTCWDLHKRGHRSVIAVSGTPSSVQCIRLLNAGADYYLDAWLPRAELVARVRVVLCMSTWLGKQSALTNAAASSI